MLLEPTTTRKDNSRVKRNIGSELPGLLPLFLRPPLLFLNHPLLLHLSHFPGLHLCQSPGLGFPPKASQHIKTGLMTVRGPTVLNYSSAYLNYELRVSSNSGSQYMRWPLLQTRD